MKIVKFHKENFYNRFEGCILTSRVKILMLLGNLIKNMFLMEKISECTLKLTYF